MMQIQKASCLLPVRLAVVLPFGHALAAADTHHEADSLPRTHETNLESTAGQPLAIDAGGVTIQFGGLAKLDVLQDFDPVGNPDQFKVNSIPVPPDPATQLGGSTNIVARGTRFSVDVRGSEQVATGMRVYVEGDFLGSGNSFRLRHAYGEWRGILAGQTWSTFQDISARPFTLDYEGPDAEIFVRQAMIRYTGKPSDSLSWSVALEDPDSQVDVSSAFAGTGRSELPDLAGNVRFSLAQARAHVQVGALLRQLRFVSSDGTIDETTSAYGLNLTGKARVLGNDSIMGQFALGSGIGRYVEAFGGTGSDAVFTTDGNLETLEGWAFVAGYRHELNEELSSNLSVAVAELDNHPDQADTAIQASRLWHLNLVYTPFPQFLAGAELMRGERENSDGSSGDATRLQLSLQYKFR